MLYDADVRKKVHEYKRLRERNQFLFIGGLAFRFMFARFRSF